MKYYKGFLYIWGDYTSQHKPLYKYDLATGIWISIQPLGKQIGLTVNYGLCIYQDYLYSVLGSWTSSHSIYRINLISGNYELEELIIDKSGLGDSGYGYDCTDNMMYLFGGTDGTGQFNTLSSLDFDRFPLKFNILSINMNTPTPRSNHAIEVYDNNLYIYGGITNGGSQ